MNLHSVVKTCHECGEQFLAGVRPADQQPPFYCHNHISQAHWWGRLSYVDKAFVLGFGTTDGILKVRQTEK